MAASTGAVLKPSMAGFHHKNTSCEIIVVVMADFETPIATIYEYNTPRTGCQYTSCISQACHVSMVVVKTTSFKISSVI